MESRLEFSHASLTSCSEAVSIEEVATGPHTVNNIFLPLVIPLERL